MNKKGVMPMINETEFEFGQALKRIRESRGLSQRDLGALMGIDPNRISNWELGYSMPQMRAFRVMCIALNCPPGDLLGLSHAPLTADEYSLVKGFRALDDAGQHTMMAVLESQLTVRSGSDG